MSNEIALPGALEKQQVLLGLDYLAKTYQQPKYDDLFRGIKKDDWPNLTEKFPALLRSMGGVIQAYDDIGEILATSAGALCSHELARGMTRDSSKLLTLFLGKFGHCTHKPPREIMPYFADVNGVPSQFVVRAIMLQFRLQSTRSVELAVMLIGEHPDMLKDLANPASHLDARTIAQAFTQLIIHPNGELTTHFYKPMDIALPQETFLRELQGAPLLPPRGKLYAPAITSERGADPSLFLNPRVQMERQPMKRKELIGFMDLLCSYLDEVKDCLNLHR